MLPCTLALLTQLAIDERRRTRVVGVWAAIGGCALPAGPFIGGALAQVIGWRAVFWVNVPVLAAALIVVLRTRLPRTSPAAVARLLLAVPTGARWPLAAACGVAGLMNLCVLGSLFLLTQTLQEVHHLRPLATGLVMLPGMVPLPLLGTASGRLTCRLGPWPTSAVGLAISAAGFAIIASALGPPDYPALLAGLCLWGVGLGVLTPAIVTAAIRTVPDAPGMASGASNTARQTGGALGVALFSAVVGTVHPDTFNQHISWTLYGCAAAFAVTAVLAGTGGGARAS
jgi:DHA2 family methylenomycin A resistance protein-like MFS transporter